MPASQFITTSHRFWEETGKFTCLFSQFPWLQRLYDSLLDLSNIYLSPNPVHSELCIQVFANIPLFISYLCTSTYNGAISPPEPSPNSSACLWRPSLIQSCPPFLILSPLYLYPKHTNLLMVLERHLPCLCLCSYCSFGLETFPLSS